MKKLLLSILFVSVATLANAQKSEVAEAKKIWSIFQLTMSVDPAKKAKDTSATKKPAAARPQGGGGGQQMAAIGKTGIPDIPGKGRGGAAPAGGTRYVEQDKKPKPGSFIEKQLLSLNDGLSHLNKAAVYEKTKDLAETWSYKALFHSTIAAIDTIDTQNSIDNQKLAEEAIAKAKALDTKKDEKENITQSESNVNVAISNRAITAYNKKDYVTALNYFNEYTAKNPEDMSMYLNAGVMANLAERYPEAIQNFKKVISLNSPDSKDLYNQIINLSLEKVKDTAAAFGLLKEALAKYPDDAGFIGTETDLYITKGDIVKSQQSLNKLIAKDPTKPVYHYLMGDTYYKQALLIQDQRKAIDPKKIKEFDALTAKMTGLIDQALPFYKKSLELNPVFVPALETLKQIYGFKNDTNNFNDIKKRLDAIPAN